MLFQDVLNYNLIFHTTSKKLLVFSSLGKFYLIIKLNKLFLDSLTYKQVISLSSQLFTSVTGKTLSSKYHSSYFFKLFDFFYIIVKEAVF